MQYARHAFICIVFIFHAVPVCQLVVRVRAVGRGVAEIAKIFCARHTEMRKIHFGHWQWVPAGAAAVAAAIFMLERYLYTTDSVNCGCMCSLYL